MSWGEERGGVRADNVAVGEICGWRVIVRGLPATATAKPAARSKAALLSVACHCEGDASRYAIKALRPMSFKVVSFKVMSFKVASLMSAAVR